MQVAVVLFAGLTALDAVGPAEVLQQLPDVELAFVGPTPGPVRTHGGLMGLHVDLPFEDVPRPDVVVVPGGPGVAALLDDERTLAWLRTAHATTRWTTSVCTGSLLLAAAGLLAGRTATTHWSAHERLRALGARPVHERWVEHPDLRVITAAGVSAGIDMALRLVALLEDDTAAGAAQLLCEYDPAPPGRSGSVRHASEAVRTRADAYAVLWAARGRPG